MYKISIDQDSLIDIQNAKEWYNKQSPKLGDKFIKQTILQIDSLKNEADLYAIRYENVRCMLIKKYPFMVHFTIIENHNLVEIFAILHTSRNPTIWAERIK